MSYDTAATIRNWTDAEQRNPTRYTILGYMNGVQVGSSVIVYTEAEMFKEYYKMANQATRNPRHPVYDQIKVTREDVVVPSATE